jgi:hypothetical protein
MFHRLVMGTMAPRPNVQRDHAAGVTLQGAGVEPFAVVCPSYRKSHKISDNAQEFLAPSA